MCRWVTSHRNVGAKKGRYTTPGVFNLLEVAGQFENLVQVAGHTVDKSYIQLLGSNSEATP
jgi:hypothetical protein